MRGPLLNAVEGLASHGGLLPNQPPKLCISNKVCSREALRDNQAINQSQSTVPENSNKAYQNQAIPINHASRLQRRLLDENIRRDDFYPDIVSIKLSSITHYRQSHLYLVSPLSMK